MSQTDSEYLRKQTTIYGKDPSKKLSLWHSKVNDAAYDLAVSDRKVLLLPRQKLIEAAQEKVRESGYVFMKGRSRSKKRTESSADEATTSKRFKIDETLRRKRIAELEEDMKDFRDRLGYKEKQREEASNLRNYKACDRLTEEMTSLKKELRNADYEIKELTKKEKKSCWYRRKAQERQKSSSVTDCSSLNSESESSVSLPSPVGVLSLSSGSNSSSSVPPVDSPESVDGLMSPGSSSSSLVTVLSPTVSDPPVLNAYSLIDEQSHTPDSSDASHFQ